MEELQLHYVHWIGPLIIVCSDSGTFTAAFRKLRTICAHKQGTAICLPHGQCITTCLQNVSCFAGLLYLKPQQSCKTIFAIASFQIGAFDNDPSYLHWRHIKPHLPSCANVRWLINEPIPSTLTSPMSGRKQLPLTSGTIVTINYKV